MSEESIRKLLSRRSFTAAAAAVTAGAAVAGCSQKSQGGQVSRTVEENSRKVANLDQIPEGQGVVVPSANVVVMREKGETVRGLSAICTHGGCTVSEVKNNVILCPCHGSKFDAQNGSPIAGPAVKPLANVSLVVRNGQIFLS
ncbi:ubiquinol-cytochrome c reductase iron-sulfur subunit [Streptomyces sp. NPDC007355]|uniref:QcrA and Rieske domain-containing protein n=1 Tax=Streptomyces sp. NPDC007355 TaxID=3364778 RepID=UPI0036960081